MSYFHLGAANSNKPSSNSFRIWSGHLIILSLSHKDHCDVVLVSSRKFPSVDDGNMTSWLSTFSGVDVPGVNDKRDFVDIELWVIDAAPLDQVL